MKYYYTMLGIYMFFVLSSCIVASVTRKKYKQTPLILAPIILWMGFAAESLGFLHNQIINIYSGWIFNIYGFFFFLFFYKLIYDYLYSKKKKKIFFALGVLVLITYIVRLFTLPSFNDRMIYLKGFELAALLLITLSYAVELLKSNKVLSLKESPHFFFILGYLFFKIVYTPLNVAYDLNLRVFTEEFYITLKSVQVYVLIAMHILFMFGFIWTQPKKEKLTT